MQKLPFLTLVLTFFCYQVNAQFIPKKGSFPKAEDSYYYQKKIENSFHDDSETLYELIDCIRVQIRTVRQKFSNIQLSPDYSIPIFLDDLFILNIDSLKSVSLDEIESITIDYNSRRVGIGSQSIFGVVEIETYKKKED
ncbi:hypothetical protein R9C00_26030 [Flammeovirgaceae bacterium SG7u.111]|nr:hypothetical protein [Flammeovirgaceae bacterium SG7u.132]WPO35158.1 hypothetical protein R9C00_26030 [Flammeovirgaceae bacterium SG7u.111]